MPPREGLPVMVLADTYEMARLHARELELGREGADWRYLTEVHQLLGIYPGGHYALRTAGGRNLHGDALNRRIELFRELRTRGWTRID